MFKALWVLIGSLDLHIGINSKDSIRPNWKSIKGSVIHYFILINIQKYLWPLHQNKTKQITKHPSILYLPFICPSLNVSALLSS